MSNIRFAATSLFVTVLAAASSLASASDCYIVYDRNDQMIYRDIRSPIDLSGSIGRTVNAKWRGSALVIVGDAPKCVPFELTGNALT
ncbi:MAG: hypothetical protein ACRDAM_20970, partial [Casimicrobium sp.]